jgi:hypothetical protein
VGEPAAGADGDGDDPPESRIRLIGEELTANTITATTARQAPTSKAERPVRW